MKPGWEVKTLGEVYDVRDGTHDSPKYQDKGYPLITSKNLKTGGLSFELVKFISEQDYLHINRRSKVNKGDLLFAMIGTIGNPTLVEVTPNFAIKNVALLKPPENQSVHFLKYYLATKVVIAKMKADAKGTTQKFVGLNYLRNFRIPLPPLEEQKRIVSILDKAFEGLDRARENAEANLKSARELFGAHLENRLRFLTKNHQCLLGDHIDLLSGFAFKSKAYSEKQTDMRLMRGDNIIPGQVRWENAKHWPISDTAAYERYLLKANDLLIAMDRTWIKSGIKYVLLEPKDIPSLLVQRVARLRSKPTILSSFLELLIGNKSFEKYVLDIQTGLGVPHISSQQIKDFVTAVPSLQEQHDIVAEATAMRTKTSALLANYASQNQDISDLRQSLLKKAFAGELT